MSEDRFICTKETPWTSSRGRRAIHPDAEYIDDYSYSRDEVCERYKCPHCGKKFEVELSR